MQNTEETVVSISLTVSEVNFVIETLAQLPYKTSCGLIETIRNQTRMEIVRQKEFLNSGQPAQ